MIALPEQKKSDLCLTAKYNADAKQQPGNHRYPIRRPMALRLCLSANLPNILFIVALCAPFSFRLAFAQAI